jgi:hypothetical protein
MTAPASTTSETWEVANLRRLHAGIDTVLACVGVAFGAGDENARRRAIDAEREALEAMPAPAALERLSGALELSAFERSLLLLCAGVELDPRVRALCPSRGGGCADFPRATPGMALAALPGAHCSATAPGAPLRRWRLLEVEPAQPLMDAALRIDEWALHHLCGVGCLDVRLSGIIDSADEPEADLDGVEPLARAITGAGFSRSGPVVWIRGADAFSRRSLAAAAMRSLGLRPYLVREADVPPGTADRDLLARLWERQAIMSRVGLIAELATESGDQPSRALRLIEDLAAPVVVCGGDGGGEGHDLGRPCIVIRASLPDAAAAERVWRRELGDDGAEIGEAIPQLAEQFPLSPPRVRGVVAAARAAGRMDALGLTACCVEQTRGRVDELTERLQGMTRLRDIVAPPGTHELLAQIVAHARRRRTVMSDWSFGRGITRGQGITALFAGPSGTGKTLAAEAIAGELGLDLCRVDLSSVVSKYIGETSKNLRRVFDAADAGGVVLLFDEADALFARRSEHVHDSLDRHANGEVAYLLQRMEQFRGVAILTSNLKGAIDQAFLRRLRFVVTFSFPDAAQRSELWRRVFPSAAPLGDIDPVKLARLNVSGAAIRNIALGAAFLAADAGEPICMRHVLIAARAECQKLEKSLTDAEIGGWI